MSRPSVPHYCPNCHERVLLSLEPADDSPMVGTAKASAITGLSERTLRKWCRADLVAGAKQEGGYQAKWLLPRAWCEAWVKKH